MPKKKSPIYSMLGLEELKTHASHFMGGFWALLFFTATGLILRGLRLIFRDELWGKALYYLEVIDLIVLVLLFAIMGIAMLWSFVKRYFRDGTHIVLA